MGIEPFDSLACVHIKDNNILYLLHLQSIPCDIAYPFRDISKMLSAEGQQNFLEMHHDEACIVFHVLSSVTFERI